MVKDNEDSLEIRREMTIPEELEYLARNSIRTYNNGWANPGFLEHAYREIVRNDAKKESKHTVLKSA